MLNNINTLKKTKSQHVIKKNVLAFLGATAFAATLLIPLFSKPSFAYNSCSRVVFEGSSQLYINDSSGNLRRFAISNSNSVRGWSYKGSSLASYVVFDGSQSVVIVERFSPDSGFNGKIATVRISGSDSILGWDWDEDTEIASYMYTNGSQTFIAVERFNPQTGFYGQKTTTNLSNSALSRSGYSWTWNGSVAQYSINGNTKVEDFDGSSFGGQYPNNSQSLGNNLVARSCW